MTGMRNRKDGNDANSQQLQQNVAAADNSHPNQNQQTEILYGDHGRPVHERNDVPVNTKIKLGHVLVQVHSVGLNPVDAKGVIGDKLPYTWTTIRNWLHRFLVKDSRVGFDFAGIVLGSNTRDSTDLAQGTRVYGTMPPLQGSAAEIIQVPIHQIAKAPSNLTLDQAAALPLVSLTAWQALQPCIAAGQSSVLIIGASGGTGHIALQVAKALGANHVTAVCSGRNTGLVSKCGATHVVDYTKSEGVVKQLQQAPGCPYDVILDCVTSADPTDFNFGYPAMIQNPDNGLVRNKDNAPHSSKYPYLYQRLGGPCFDWVRATFDRPKILPPRLVWWPHVHDRLFWIKFPFSQHQLDALRGIAEQGKLVPHVSKVLDGLTASNVQEGFDDILQRRVQGKIVVKVRQEDKRM